jgi:hypothetical protein
MALNRQMDEAELLCQIAANLASLEQLLAKCSDEWGYEDPVYRSYHQSYKVFWLQEQTKEIVARLQALAPKLPLNRWFMEIIESGTGKEFSLATNDTWAQSTRPIVEAFFHARYFLEMVCKYGKELSSPVQVLPSGWAAILCLYNLR